MSTKLKYLLLICFLFPYSENIIFYSPILLDNGTGRTKDPPVAITYGSHKHNFMIVQSHAVPGKCHWGSQSFPLHGSNLQSPTNPRPGWGSDEVTRRADRIWEGVCVQQLPNPKPLSGFNPATWSMWTSASHFTGTSRFLTTTEGRQVQPK